jgi:hypothetical protein
MNEVTLQGDDERLRQECEQEAGRSWPGARVLVHPVSGKFRAAIFLAEDGVEPDASVEPSALHRTPHDALEEVLHALGR